MNRETLARLKPAKPNQVWNLSLTILFGAAWVAICILEWFWLRQFEIVNANFGDFASFAIIGTFGVAGQVISLAIVWGIWSNSSVENERYRRFETWPDQPWKWTREREIPVAQDEFTSRAPKFLAMAAGLAAVSIAIFWLIPLIRGFLLRDSQVLYSGLVAAIGILLMVLTQLVFLRLSQRLLADDSESWRIEIEGGCGFLGEIMSGRLVPPNDGGFRESVQLRLVLAHIRTYGESTNYYALWESKLFGTEYSSGYAFAIPIMPPDPIETGVPKHEWKLLVLDKSGQKKLAGFGVHIYAGVGLVSEACEALNRRLELANEVNSHDLSPQSVAGSMHRDDPTLYRSLEASGISVEVTKGAIILSRRPRDLVQSLLSFAILWIFVGWGTWFLCSALGVIPGIIATSVTLAFVMIIARRYLLHSGDIRMEIGSSRFELRFKAGALSSVHTEDLQKDWKLVRRFPQSSRLSWHGGVPINHAVLGIENDGHWTRIMDIGPDPNVYFYLCDLCAAARDAEP